MHLAIFLSQNYDLIITLEDSYPKLLEDLKSCTSRIDQCSFKKYNPFSFIAILTFGDTQFSMRIALNAIHNKTTSEFSKPT